MFGREMLTFQNWSEESNIDEILAIDNRTTEIRDHFENIIPDTVNTIAQRKQTQSKYQDKDNNILPRHSNLEQQFM